MIKKVSVIGSGAMGIGIAQVAAQAECEVTLYDNNPDALESASKKLIRVFDRLVEKGKFSQQKADKILSKIEFTHSLERIDESELVIEAIVENLDIKKQVFQKVENIVSKECILSTNTSSLSIASIASACKHPERFIGLHFFNPAPLMPLVEIAPAISTNKELAELLKKIMLQWGKSPAITKDTPGFIVNRVARPFYGEAIRIYEEGIADIPTIDWAMKSIGGFRMGPFQLMDFIGHDVNYVVTETVFKAFYFDPRYKPSISQKRLVEAGYFGKKSGIGFYDYSEKAIPPKATENIELGKYIVHRILAMLINEAADALYLNIASKEDLDLAVTKGVNYPKGLLKWADELGVNVVLNLLDTLYQEYGEDRYRSTILLKRMVKNNTRFYN